MSVVNFAHLARKRKKSRLRAMLHDGKPRLALFDENDATRAVLGDVELTTDTGVIVKRAVSSLVLFSKEGESIWSAP